MQSRGRRAGNLNRMTTLLLLLLLLCLPSLAEPAVQTAVQVLPDALPAGPEKVLLPE